MKFPVGIGIGVALWIGALGVLHFKPWRRPPAESRPTLEVGFLPVT